MANDGAVLVRDEAGKIANLEEGIGSRELYLYMIKGDPFLPFISNVKTVGGSTSSEIARNAANEGFDYYATLDGVGYAYQRTAGKDAALKTADGNPVIALNLLGATKDVSLKQWVKQNFNARTASGKYLLETPGYVSALADESLCSIETMEVKGSSISVLTANADVLTKMDGYWGQEQQSGKDENGLLAATVIWANMDTAVSGEGGSGPNILMIVTLIIAVALLTAAGVIFGIRRKKAKAKDIETEQTAEVQVEAEIMDAATENTTNAEEETK